MHRIIAIITLLTFAFATAACEQSVKQPEGIVKVPETVIEKKQEPNCVKKDKNGKCPPPPSSPKPTPKKPIDSSKS